MGGGYAFIYDEALSSRRRERDLAELESRLTTLGLNGRTIRLSMFRSVKEALAELIRQGAQTLVVVGNDQTLYKIIGSLIESNLVLGYLPVFGPAEVAKPLGIPLGIESCDVLAARLVDTLDIGVCQGQFFLTEARLENTTSKIKCDNRFSITPISGGTMVIRNLRVSSYGQNFSNDAKDGLLEVIVRAHDLERSRWIPWRMNRRILIEETRLLVREAQVEAPGKIDMLIEDQKISGTNFSFSIIPRKLKVITGRARRLSSSSPLVKKEKQAIIA